MPKDTKISFSQGKKLIRTDKGPWNEGALFYFEGSPGWLQHVN